MTEDGERLATLETQSAEASKQREDIRHRLDSQDNDLKAIRRDVHSIKETISGHMGFLKGVVFVFTAIGSALGAAAVALWNKFSG